VAAVTRCIQDGRFRPGDPVQVAHQMWIALHGLATLELGGYLVEPYDADSCFHAQVCNLMVGAGDDVEAARESVDLALERSAAEQGPPVRARHEP
jgi:hypothetical protein